MRSKGWGTYTTPSWRRIRSIVSARLSPRGIFSFRNSPITSPWPSVLTSSPTITRTPNAVGLRLRLQCAGDLVVVGHRDRPEARVTGAGQQHLHRRRAVVGVVGVHVQVDLDPRTLGEHLRELGIPAAVPARRHPRVDLLEALGGQLVVGDELVLGREGAAHQLDGRRQRRGARVQAPEEALHEAPCQQRREQPLAGGVKRADVQGARVAQGRVGGRGGERLVHVHEVQRHAREHFLDVSGRRRSAAPGHGGGRRERPRAPLPPRSRAGLPPSAPSSRRSGASASGPQLLARLAHPLLRARGGEHEHAVPPSRELGRRARPRGVDLVLDLPRVRRDVGDRERGGHRLLIIASARRARRSSAAGAAGGRAAAGTPAARALAAAFGAHVSRPPSAASPGAWRRSR